MPMKLPDLPPPSLRLKLDAEALAANWRALDALSGTATAGAAVKADAYGLGVDTVVPTLLAAGAQDFFVAHWSEVRPRSLPCCTACCAAKMHNSRVQQGCAR